MYYVAAYLKPVCVSVTTSLTAVWVGSNRITVTFCRQRCQRSADVDATVHRFALHAVACVSAVNMYSQTIAHYHPQQCHCCWWGFCGVAATRGRKVKPLHMWQGGHSLDTHYSAVIQEKPQFRGCVCLGVVCICILEDLLCKIKDFRDADMCSKTRFQVLLYLHPGSVVLHLKWWVQQLAYPTSRWWFIYLKQATPLY